MALSGLYLACIAEDRQLKITLKNISEHCTLSMDDERKLQHLLNINDEADILQKMVDFLAADNLCDCVCEACQDCEGF